MKKILAVLSTALAVSSAQAQFQLANSDFEQWEEVHYTDAKTCDEPLNWSSFYDATGSFKSLGTSSTAQIYKDEETCPGSTGQYSCRITSATVFGVVAQGNLTTGCVNMGSTNASDASGNYNYINEERTDQAMRFTGHPDAVRFWVRFSGVKKGNCSVFLTTQGYYQDPVSGDGNTATLVARALSGEAIVSNDTWTQYTVPFEWKTTDEPYYALVNVSTCSEPGAGNVSDYLYIDDIEMVYNSEATAVMYDGHNVLNAGQQMGEFEADKLGEIRTNGQAAQTSWQYDAEAKELVVTVTGENISEDATNVHEYRIAFGGEGEADVIMDDPSEEEIAFTPVAMERGVAYIIRNKDNGMFLQDNNQLGTTPTVWTVDESGNVMSADGKYMNITIQGSTGVLGSNTPSSTSLTTSGTTAVAMTIGGDEDGYTFSVSATWKYGFFNRNTANYTGYASATGATLSVSASGSGDDAKWLVTPAEAYVAAYQNRAARTELYNELLRARELGMNINDYYESMTANSGDTEAINELLSQVREDETTYMNGLYPEYTEDRTTLLGTTDLSDGGTWTTNLIQNNGGQHWSGDNSRGYYEQTGAQWAQTSWSVAAEQTVTLPAGQYVLKAIGRSSASVEAYVSVNDEKVMLPARGDTGWGVDVNGKADYTADGTYCLDGVGRGWEYRYLPFVLTESQEVTVKVAASTESQYQWFSVSDISLWAVPTPVMEMTSFTYDGTAYTPDEEGKIDLSSVRYDETAEQEVQTAGYGVVSTSYDEAASLLTITLSQEEGMDYGMDDKVYEVQFYVYEPALESLTFNGEPVADGDEIDAYYDADKLACVGNADTEEVSVVYDSETWTVTVTARGHGHEKKYTLYFKDDTDRVKTYVEPLLLSIDGEESDAGNITVYIVDQGDGKYELQLRNFIMDMGGTPVPVGTIALPNIEMTETAEGDYGFTTSQNITIAAGNVDGIAESDWFGPVLGEVPVELTEGYTYDEYMYARIVINMMGQNIVVVVGDKSNVPSSVNSVKESREGQMADGKYLMGGRIVVVKDGKQYELNGSRR